MDHDPEGGRGNPEPCGPDGLVLSATSASRAAFLQCVRWGAWCPFQEPADWKGDEVQVVLRGGAEPNPHGVMTYSAETSADTKSPAPLSASGSAQLSPLPGTEDSITFRLSSALERKTSGSPKASPRKTQEDAARHRRSPLRAASSLSLPYQWFCISFAFTLSLPSSPVSLCGR
ncbi:hypothetical protein EYF80_043958 [Liparis tanakae]|uniref:Uncharacterized protein n=1 Tax=Liparis tanakae TaxID=230148 RepID=A0A4Z2FYQ0_9TELE|nr:hypothetical protein EYF80_043958 [Liparis tanakae]